MACISASLQAAADTAAGGYGGKRALHPVCAHLWVCRPCRRSSPHLARSWSPPHSGPRCCRACTLLGGGPARVQAGEQASRLLTLRCSKYAGSTHLTVLTVRPPYLRSTPRRAPDTLLDTARTTWLRSGRGWPTWSSAGLAQSAPCMQPAMHSRCGPQHKNQWWQSSQQVRSAALRGSVSMCPAR